MVVDYSEHKPVSKNRPRKQPASVFFFSLFVAVSIAYILGVATGWLIFRPSHKSGADMRNATAGVSQKTEIPAPNKVQAPAEPAGKGMEPTLTFYETLPKGNKELMGSGLNQTKGAEQPPAKAAPKTKPPAPAAKPAVAQEPPAQNKEAVKTPAKPPEPGPAKETTAREGEGKAKFVVQVASYHLKKEAEEARDRLKENGMAAYIVESNIPEKGTWYRVRVGRHLDQQKAREVAEKAGTGSILVPE